MTVGFIGLGHMGQAMARNLLRAGFAVAVYNRSRAKADALAADGAEVVTTVAAACRGDVVITMLADDGAVEETVFRREGLMDSLSAGSLHVSMSTISVALAKRLTNAHAAAGSAFVSAPVLGRPDMAAAAKLFIVVGGPPATVHRSQPLFDAMGQRTFVMGEEPAIANVVKLSGNFLIASVLESLGEAVALVRKAGVDPERYLDLLTSTLFTAPVYRTYGELIAEQRFKPAGFRLPLGLKDITLVLAAAHASTTPMPLASLIHDHMLAALAQGYGEHDWSVVAALAAQNAGLVGAASR